jgi:PAS domain S-box-containing protein
MSGIIIAFANRAIWKYNQTLGELSKKEEALSILEKILHAMDVYVYITELDTDKILFVNNAMLEGFGIQRNIIGEQCWKVFQANHFEQCDFCAKKKLALAPDTSVVWEEYNTLTYRHYKNTDSIIDWPDGSKVHFQQSIDITDMKRAEAERMEALDRAERASRVKGEFLSRMSHEMRTPMNAVINMMQLAKNTHEADKRTQYLEKGDMASRHLLALINDVLNFTMLDDGTFTLETSVFSFETMMQDVLKTIEIYLEEKKQTISSSIDAAIPPDIVGDEKHLAQVIIKLLVNANKFTPENGVIQFKACVRSDEEETLTLQVEISDSGIGIPKEQQARIFDSFEQADGGASRKFGGIGLGLPIAKRIVKLMGGDMWVESEPGQGAKFSFTFIAEKKPALRHDGTDEPQDAASADQPADPFDGTVALLVDDVEINREIVLAVFEQTPMRIECAENGRQALELFSANPGKYDIIFMDINMPEMDGMEATQKIRALDAPEGARVPILAMTANSLPEDVKTYLQIGMNDHIGKPVQINDLVSKSAKYICDYLKTKATPSP